MIKKNSKLLVTGASGFLGTFLLKALKKKGYDNLYCPSYREIDLREKLACEKAVKDVDGILHLAGNVGGVGYLAENPGSIFYDNATISLNLIEAARESGVKKFIAVGTATAYPQSAPVPFKETDFWNGYPAEAVAAYAMSKKLALVQLQAYRKQFGFNGIYLILANMYGPGDNFDEKSSGVIPALMRLVRQAKAQKKSSIEVCGAGSASREFLYVEDGADAIMTVMEKYEKGEPVNISSGKEVTIKELAGTICRLMNYSGRIAWNKHKPTGQPRVSLDTSRAAKEFGFRAKTSLEEGLRQTIAWYEQQVNS